MVCKEPRRIRDISKKAPAWLGICAP